MRSHHKITTTAQVNWIHFQVRSQTLSTDTFIQGQVSWNCMLYVEAICRGYMQSILSGSDVGPLQIICSPAHIPESRGILWKSNLSFIINDVLFMMYRLLKVNDNWLDLTWKVNLYRIWCENNFYCIQNRNMKWSITSFKCIFIKWILLLVDILIGFSRYTPIKYSHDKNVHTYIPNPFDDHWCVSILHITLSISIVVKWFLTFQLHIWICNSKQEMNNEQ